MKSRKKLLSVIFAVIAIVLCMAAFVACEGDPDNPDTPNPPDTPGEITFTVKFETNGGTEIKDIVFTDVSTFKMPEDPTKDGFEFEGWYLDANFTNVFSKDSMTKANITLYAKWKENLKAEIVSVDGATIDGKEIAMFAESGTEKIDLTTIVTVGKNCSWRLYFDEDCTREIPTRSTGVLNDHDNSFYIFVSLKDSDDTAKYHLTIHKIASISIILSDGTNRLKTVNQNCYQTVSQSVTEGITVKNNDIVGWYYKDGDAEIDFVFGENGTVVKDSMTIYAKLSLRDYNDGTVFTLKEDNTYAITGYTGDDADVIIPVKYKGLAVTEISANAFKDNQTIKSIKIASSIKIIGDNAFNGCTELQTIEISPSEKLYIGYDAFFKSGLKKVITLSIFDWCKISFSDLDSNPIFIARSLYVGEEKVTEIEIPANVTEINTYAFINLNDGDFSVMLHDNVTRIGLHAFDFWNGYKIAQNRSAYYPTPTNKYYAVNNTNSINSKAKIICEGAFANKSIETITIPSSVTKVPYYTFNNCKKLTTVKLEGNVTEIGDYAFYYCSALTSITLPLSVKTIGVNAFYSCWALTDIEIPSSVISIGEEAFCACEALTTLTLKEGLVSIGDEAFAYCKVLKAVSLPDSLKEMGAKAFFKCSKLETVTIGAGIAEIKSETFAYCAISTLTVPGNVKTIGKSAFYKNHLYSLDLKEGVVTACADAFGSCRGYEVSLPDSLEFSCSAFNGSFILTSQYMDNDLKYTDNLGYVGNNSNPYLILWNCKSNAESCTIRQETKYILWSAFNGCSSLTSLTIPKNIKESDGITFKNCSSLIAVNFENDITKLTDYMFSGCSSLTTWTIPATVKEIGTGVFRECTALTGVVFAGSETKISDYMFYGCTALKTITIPSTVDTIGKYAFCQSGLTSITLPEGVKLIDAGAFVNCASLEEISIPDSIERIAVPYDSSYYYHGAFYGCSKLSYTTDSNGLRYLGNSNNRYLVLVTIDPKGNARKTTGSTMYGVTVNDKTKVIAEYAIYCTSKVYAVNIPASVQFINERGIYECTGLASVNCAAKSKPDGWHEGWMYNCSNGRNGTLVNWDRQV